jgi:hypothetical protein
MAEGNVVTSGTVEVEYDIREWTVDGETVYDAVYGNGAYVESDEYFATTADAVRWVKSRLR